MPVCAHWPNTAPSFNEDPRKGRHWSSDNAIDANDEGIKSIFDSLKSMPTLKDVPVDVPEPLPAEQQKPAAQDPQPFVAQNPTMQQSRVFRTQRETGNMSSATVAATDSRTRCDTIRHWLTPHRLHCIVLAAYVIVVGTVMCFHEPWFDEAQAWLIARDCSWREMILKRPHYEGHPPLWWMMLADLQSLHKLRSDVKQQVSAAVSNLHNAEAVAAAIAVPERNGDLDPAGWYTLATNVASTMGVQIEQTMEFSCGGQSGENPNGFVAAYYCQMPDRSQRNVVHMLTTHPDWTQTSRSPWLVTMVKHELSHRSIMISCGTTQPTIAADRTEAVTNSYSVPFFGADRDRITNQQQGVAEYATDAHSDQLATAIHDGNCG